MSDDFFKELQDSFLSEAEDLLSTVEALFLKLESNPNDLEVYNQLARLAHNFKGSGKAVGFDHLSLFSHQLENLLIALKNGVVAPTPQNIDLLLRCSDQLRSDVENLKNDVNAPLDHTLLLSELDSALGDPATHRVEVKAGVELSIEELLAQDQASQQAAFSKEAVPVGTVSMAAKKETAPVGEQKSPSGTKSEEYVRIPLKKLEELLNTCGEQVILQSSLEQARTNFRENEDLIHKTITSLSKLTHDLQHAALALRMVTLNPLFSKLERAVRDAARATGKTIKFEALGGETEIDKSMVDALSDATTHMVRNSVDHGIEDNIVDRVDLGKPPEGKVTLRAYRSGGSFFLEIQDDGKGLDPEKIRRKAVEKGLVSESQKLTREEIFNLIFENGFSTKDAATDLSGRGVGMNVVKESILAMKGSYEIISEVGQGTTFRLRLPLTLAIFNGFVLKIGEDKYVVPASDIDEVIRLSSDDVKLLDSPNPIVKIRDEVFFVDSLSKKFGATRSHFQKEVATVPALLIRSGVSMPTALIIDEILSLQKTVYKSISEEARAFKGASGATILGDGSVAMILDVKQFTPRKALGAA